MPTFTDAPAKGFSGPPRKPDPGVNVHPDSRLANQKPATRTRGQSPQFLQAHGFNGDINSFNSRVDKAYNGYANAYGKEPSPGLVWDVARNPKVMDNQIPDLFRVPLDSRQLKPEQDHLESTWNGQALHVRQDGQVQRTNGLTAYQSSAEFHHQELQNPPHILPVKEFQKKYPAIEMGMFPQLPFSKTFWQDVYTSQGHEQTIKDTIGNMSPKQMGQLIAGSGTTGNQLVNQQAGLSAQQSNFAEQQAAAAAAAEVDPAKKKAVFDSTLKKFLGTTLGQDATEAFNKAHQRNTERQQWLIDHDPHNLFAGLQANGVFDKNWMVALDKWSRTPGAASSYLQTLAQQNEFPTTPKGIQQMQEALQAKNEYVNSKEALPDKWIAQSMPLQWFSHHKYDLSVIENAKDFSGQNVFDIAKTLDQNMKDFWHYETTDLNWRVFPVALLQAGFRGIKLGYNVVGGAWNQAIADSTGLTTMFGQLADGKSVQQIAHSVHQALEENPDLVRTLGFGFIPQNLRGTPAVLDQIGNFVLQTAAALLIDGPGYKALDETKPLGAWKANAFAREINTVAYTQIKAGDLGAAEAMFGGHAADPFIRATYKGVQDGSTSFHDFHNMASEFARDGKTTLPDGSEFGGAGSGSISPHLRNKNMPKHVTPLYLKRGLRAAGDRIGNFGMDNKVTNSLSTFLRSQKGLLEIAQPLGKVSDLHYLDTRALKTFIIQNDLLPEKEAQEVVGKYILARGADNTVGMDKILKGLKTTFDQKYPLKAAKGFPAQFESLLETEGLVKAKFPSMDERFRADPGPLNSIKNGTDDFTRMANEVGRKWRQTILATGPGLFYKHALRDPLAGFLGGMKLTQTSAMKDAEEAIRQLADRNPERLRVLGATRHLVVGADTVYSNSLRLADGEKEFYLQDELHATQRKRWVMKFLGPKQDKGVAVAAAEFLRNQVNSSLYPLYEDYKVTRDAGPLVDKVLSDKNLSAQMEENTHLSSQLAKIKKEFKAAIAPEHEGQLHIPGSENAGTADALKEALRLAKRQAANAYVEMVVKRFDGIAQTAREAGIPDLMEQAAKLQRAHPGQADDRLAKLLLENQVNLRVPDGKVVPMSRFDRVTGTAIRAYMKPNRATRARMFDHMQQQYFLSFMKSGWDPLQAFDASAEAAKQATMFHLLDFSNMLEFERKYRGFLPFFTKHRLFIKWLAGTIVHRPGLVGPLHIISQHLDSYGRLNFTLPIPGVGPIPANVNLAKMMFLSSEQQPATIPLANLIPGVRNTSLSSQYTRIDPIFSLWGHIIFDGFNYDAVAKHLDPYTRARLDKYMALYAINQRMKHGLGSYVSPHDAFKWAALKVSRDIPVNGLFITPFGVSSPGNPPQIQKLNDQYDKLLVSNPKAAQALLTKHPEIGLAWGKAENFNVYNHMTQMWGMYDKIQGDYSKVEDKFSKMELEGKELTPADYKEMHAASVKYSNQIQNLRMLDANLWNHDTNNKGEQGFPPVSQEELSTKQPFGPWYTQFSHDPLGTVQKLENLFGGAKAFSAKDLHNIYGADLVQAEVAISSAKDSTTREYWLNQVKRLQGAQKVTANQTFYQAYHSAYSSYQNNVFKLYTKAKTASGENKALLEWKAAEAIRNQYEHPYIKFDGKQVKVLPFADYSTLQATPQTRIKDIFKNAIGFSYGSMTLDQRLALGLPDATPKLDAAWHDFEYNTAAYEQQTGKTASSSYRDALAIALNKTTPGFWKAYQISKMPRSFVLYDYGHGAFAGRYGSEWKQVVQLAIQSYNSNKYGWSNYVTSTLYPFIQQRWPKGFMDELKIAGGANFLISLNQAWG